MSDAGKPSDDLVRNWSQHDHRARGGNRGGLVRSWGEGVPCIVHAKIVHIVHQYTMHVGVSRSFEPLAANLSLIYGFLHPGKR